MKKLINLIFFKFIRDPGPLAPDFFDPAGAATNCRRDNMTQGKISVKRQATSDKPPESGFKRQATSSKDYLKNFLLMRNPEALVQASGLRLPGS